MKFIPVTRIERELNEAAQERYDEIEQSLVNSQPDDKDEIDWELMGIPRPEGYNSNKSAQIVFDAILDYDIFQSDYLLRIDLVKGLQRVVPTIEKIIPYTIVYFDDGSEITITEDLETILTLTNK